MTKLPALGFLFSITVRVAVVAKLVILWILFLISFVLGLIKALVAKLVILDISFYTSFIFALGAAVVAKLVKLGVLSSIFLILALYKFFFNNTISYIIFHSLSLLISI